jgi:hypothetical protein
MIWQSLAENLHMIHNADFKLAKDLKVKLP